MAPTNSHHLFAFQDRYDYEPVQISKHISSKQTNLRIIPGENTDDIVNHPYLQRNAIFGHRYSTFFFVVAFLLGLLIGHDLMMGSKTNGSTYLEEKVIEMPKPTQLTAVESLGSLSRITIKLWETIFLENFGVYRDMVLDKTLLYRIFQCSDASREKLTRRLMLKLLEAQILGTTERVTFTWVTAGDSSAAAHGNMYSQSYTKNMEEIVKVAFDSVGINFVARNHAIAGVGSAPELSLCMESVYGKDIDVLMWDFGRTERLSYHKVNLFGYRAAVHPSTPAIVVMDSSAGEHWRRFQNLEELGLSAILMDEAVMSHVLNGRLPDASSTDFVREGVTEAVQHFICKGYIEGSQPCDDPSQNFVCDAEGGDVCTAQKYNSHLWCPGGVRYQKSFNPGW